MTLTKEQIEMYASAADATQTFEMDKSKLIAVEPEHVQELARIALASLEAEAVADVVAWSSQNEERTCDVRLRRHDIKPGPLYTAPPATVSVPAALDNDIDSDDHPLLWSYNNGWNAYRAAMLQGADGALTNEDTKRVGELVMWVKRLAHSLRKANPDSKLQSDAMDYLSRKGLIGVEDILR
ncbi:TPA: hypothetical protein ACW720_003532 [Enterobacter asburiae]